MEVSWFYPCTNFACFISIKRKCHKEREIPANEKKTVSPLSQLVAVIIDYLIIKFSWTILYYRLVHSIDLYNNRLFYILFHRSVYLGFKNFRNQILPF